MYLEKFINKLNPPSYLLGEKSLNLNVRIFEFEKFFLLNLSSAQFSRKVSRANLNDYINKLSIELGLPVFAICSNKKFSDNNKIWYYNSAWGIYEDMNLDLNIQDFIEIYLEKNFNKKITLEYIFDEQSFSDLSFISGLYSNFKSNNINNIDLSIYGDQQLIKKNSEKYNLVMPRESIKESKKIQEINLEKYFNSKVLIIHSDCVDKINQYSIQEMKSILCGVPYIFTTKSNTIEQLREDGFKVQDLLQLEYKRSEYQDEDFFGILKDKISEINSFQEVDFTDLSQSFKKLSLENILLAKKLSSNIHNIYKEIESKC